ncbi:MAG TPA: HAD family hydrolase [Methylophilaceae bacterium]|nr:HAD family hydrolase [Methylophilaceae bacterium]HQR60503.1 HAD family hydrolase [Methylophilaceae bacterium]
MRQVNQYRTLVFDCDGVILDSNKVRAQAFYNCALPYGDRHAAALREYHILHGGVSRYVKFEVLLRDMVGVPVTDEAMQALLHAFTTEATIGLLQCEIAPGLQDLREATPHANWILVSGADQQELRHVFAQRGIAAWFDGGIFGSPSNKDDILARELAGGNLRKPGLFFGDSRYDHQAAARAGLDFVFMSEWTDMADWQGYCREHGIAAAASFDQFMAAQR